MEDKLAIIVPFRDRQKHLDIFIPHMQEFLKDKGIDYTIFVAEQTDDRPFNYGKLCNIVVKELPEEYTYFAFHDIDMLPMNDDCDYSWPDVPIHLATQVQSHGYKLPYPQYMGGVLVINREDFESANGYSNEYWGYGFEDLDLLFRLQESGAYLEKFYDLNKVYSNYDVDDKLPYRIENVNISVNDKKHTLDSVTLEKNNWVEGVINPILKQTISDSFSISLWFKDTTDSEVKNLISFVGMDTGLFLNNNKQIIGQIWDDNGSSHEIALDYYKDTWNHCTFIVDKKEKTLSLQINRKFVSEKVLPSGFNIHPHYKEIKISDEGTNIELASIQIFNRPLKESHVDELYFNGINSLEYLESHFGITPSVNLNFGNQNKDFKYASHSHQNMVMDSGTNYNHLKIKGKLKSNEEEVSVADTIQLPIRYQGKYNSLTHEKDLNIIDRYYEYDPDVLENSDIFFHDILTKEVDWKTIGLNSLEYKVVKETSELGYESFKIIT